MNRKRREKKLAQAGKGARVVLDFETRSGVPLDWGKPDLFVVDEFGVATRLGLFKTFGFLPSEINKQMSVYSYGAMHERLHPDQTFTNERVNGKAFWDQVWPGYFGDTHIGQTMAMDIGTETHRRLDAYCKWDTHHVIHGGDLIHGCTNTIADADADYADADYAAIEARIMAQLNEHIMASTRQAFYGFVGLLPTGNLSVNRDENKAVDNKAELATSASRITIAKVVGND